ncbi:L-lactate dehydrogenase (cytochrome) [Venturia nashicola]|uniref:L-lactate dehydrogenase (Cytochrome) n=1 Tax=Venturia nashicola TaxID=86259 RepID=A0A4Z1NZ73_9PEZI|nr:L-lactate dehydrogenase (cytochrome) [Venturia nashicola]TLD25782.1 L-lactate dehydrogenase (cytochrome) [Venturia nashicola]
MKFGQLFSMACLNAALTFAVPQDTSVSRQATEQLGPEQPTPDSPAADSPPKAQSYLGYQGEIFSKGFMGSVPVVTTDPNKLEAQAKSKMTAKAFGFLACGSGEGATLEANRLAFKQYRIVPRMLVSSAPRDLSIKMFNRTYPSPVMMAPIGFQHIFHPDGEPGVAEIAQELGIPYIMSMNSHASPEEIADGNGDGQRWYQFYWQTPDLMTTQTLKKAQAAGYHVLVVTLDAFQLGWRPADLDQAYMPTNFGVGDLSMKNDSLGSLLGGLTGKDRAVNGINAQEGVATNLEAAQDGPGGLGALFGANPSWERLSFLRKNWAGPIILKGIQHPDDAKKALAAGMDGIIVSNHGGRQLDGGPGSLEVLPDIVEAVGGKIPVLFDSGIRTGADIIKALALGANAVLIGRPWAFGMGINGKAGAKEVMRGIMAQLEINMNIAGLRSIADINRSVLRRSPWAYSPRGLGEK